MCLAVQARAIYARHQWLLAFATADPVLRPNAMTYLDHALGTLADTGLTSRQRLEAVGIVAGLVRVLALEEAKLGARPEPLRANQAWSQGQARDCLTTETITAAMLSTLAGIAGGYPSTSRVDAGGCDGM